MSFQKLIRSPVFLFFKKRRQSWELSSPCASVMNFRDNSVTLLVWFGAKKRALDTHRLCAERKRASHTGSGASQETGLESTSQHLASVCHNTRKKRRENEINEKIRMRRTQ